MNLRAYGFLALVSTAALPQLAASGCSSTSDPAQTTTTGTGGTGGGGGGGGASSVTDEILFISAVSTAYCDAMAGCCPGSFDQQGCADSVSFLSSVFPGSATPATGARDPVASESCIAALTAVGAQCDPDMKQLAAAWYVCQTVYPGTKHVGEACEQDTDCEAVPNSKRACSADTQTCEFQAAVVIAEEGEHCNNVGGIPLGELFASCDQTKLLYCEAVTQTCKAPVAAGGDCSNSGYQATCEIGYACVGHNGTDKCVAGHAVGEACWPPECDIASDPALCACGTGSSCDAGGTDRCVADVNACGPDTPSCDGECLSGRCVTWGQASTWAPHCN